MTGGGGYAVTLLVVSKTSCHLVRDNVAVAFWLGQKCRCQ